MQSVVLDADNLGAGHPRRCERLRTLSQAYMRNGPVRKIERSLKNSRPATREHGNYIRLVSYLHYLQLWHRHTATVWSCDTNVP